MTVKDIEPKDILAFIILVGGMILIGFGINHVVSGIMIMVTSYYFRKRIDEVKDKKNGKSNPAKHSS